MHLKLSKRVLAIAALFTSLTFSQTAVVNLAFAADINAGAPCDQLWDSGRETSTNKPLMCLPINQNDLTQLVFKLDTSTFPPALEPDGVIAFGRTCPESLGKFEKDSHGYQLECIDAKNREANNLIWYSQEIADSILSGLPLAKPTPKPLPSNNVVINISPSPEPEISPTSEAIDNAAPAPKIDDPTEAKIVINKKIRDITVTGATAIALAISGHSMAMGGMNSASSASGNNPTQPNRQNSPSPKDLFSTEAETRKRKRNEGTAFSESEEEAEANKEVPSAEYLPKFRNFEDRVSANSIFFSEVIADGNYLRVYKWWLNLVVYVAAICFGYLSFLNKSPLDILPNNNWLLLMVAFGLFEAAAGFLFAVTFVLLELSHVGIPSLNFAITQFVLIMVAIIPNFVGSAIRPMDRVRAQSGSKKNEQWDYLWNKATDVALSSIVSAWVGFHAVHTVRFFAYNEEQLSKEIMESKVTLSISLLLVVVLLRQYIQFLTYEKVGLRERRYYLEPREPQSKQTKKKTELIRLLLRLFVSIFLIQDLFKKFGLRFDSRELKSVELLLVSISVGLLITLPEVLKLIAPESKDRSSKYYFLNFKNSTKTFLLIMVSWLINFLWPDDIDQRNIETVAAVTIIALILLVIFFSVVEVFVKRKEDQDDWWTRPPFNKFPFKVLYYLGAIFMFSIFVAKAFELTPFN